MNNIGLLIKDLRMKCNMTQEELARAIGTTKQNIYKYENQIVTNIPMDKIEAIAVTLDVDPAYLMGWRNASSASKCISNSDPDANTIELTNDERYLITMYRGAEDQACNFALEMLENHQRKEKANHA